MAKKLKLLVTVDTNDADYNTKVSDITEKQLEKLLPVFAAIKKFKPYTVKVDGIDWTHNHNWPMGEYAPREDLGEKPPEGIYAGILTEDQFEFFYQYAPYGENGFHTVTNITVIDVKDEAVFFKRK